MTSGRPRQFIALPAAAAALALGAAALTAAPAQAADRPPLPGTQNVQKRPALSQEELLDTVRGSAAKLEQGESGAPGQEADDAGQAAPGAPGRRVDPKIIGGVDAPITDAPWMVQLHYYDDKGTSDTADDEGYFCGGTLVAPAKVLTAAHCVDGLDWAANGAVVGGTAQLPAGGDLHGGQAVSVWRQWVDPAFDDAALTSDVAVLTLGAALPYKTLQPASGTDTALYKDGTRATVYGWGRTSSTDESISQTLRKATVPIHADSTCAAFYPADFVAGRMTCAGIPASGEDNGTVSPCNGDSGGPMVVNGRIAGVVSWGMKDCVEKGSYSVYAKTSTLYGKIAPRIDDTNINGDFTADLFARKATGEAFEYVSTGTSFTRPVSGGDWGGADLVRQVDWNRDDYQDFVYRVGNGDLYWLRFDGETQWVETKIGKGWSTWKNILFPGDVTRDGVPDLVGIDKDGKIWTYPGRGDGSFGARVGGGGGWGTVQVFGKGDYSGDGKPDLLTRDSEGRLWLYAGRDTPSSPYAPRVQVGKGWNFTAYVTTGDNTGDGIADLVVRDKAGDLWIYPSRGSATAPFSARLKAGKGWNGFDLFG
ncbi:trypsin-like serine protease [Streptomyces sp. BE147]|uniref:trypsin-like serine protease n=1 Tax=unclassified Streptomyces TaxID=2593676 RepID=UPI002E7A1499|nr:trypsin-like serine protease [Streptomyces sp. BE147]MEE1741439.1 trypsin-like serine protease [Streptomyces sp. BE147]